MPFKHLGPEHFHRVIWVPDKPPPPTPPAWSRLILHESNAGDVAELDGQTYRLTGQYDLPFLRELRDAKGSLVLGGAIKRTIGERPDRIFDRLATALQNMIDRPGQGRAGYRMK